MPPRSLLAVLMIPTAGLALAGAPSESVIDVSLSGETLNLPLQIIESDGTTHTLDAPGGQISVPATLVLTRLRIGEGSWIWVEAPARLSESPCCGLELVDPGRREQARCPRGPEGGSCPSGTEAGDPGCACPHGSEPLRPALAEDPLCGPPGRCLEMAHLEFRGETAGWKITFADDAPIRTGYAPWSPGGWVHLRAIRAGQESSHLLGLRPGERYVIELGEPGIRSIGPAAD